jgi:hypothetical protein
LDRFWSSINSDFTSEDALNTTTDLTVSLESVEQKNKPPFSFSSVMGLGERVLLRFR